VQLSRKLFQDTERERDGKRERERERERGKKVKRIGFAGTTSRVDKII
jgi:hypothetical protein